MDERAEGHNGPQESVIVLLAEGLAEQIIGLAIEMHVAEAKVVQAVL